MAATRLRLLSRETVPAVDLQVQSQIWGLLSSMFPPTVLERRRDQRYPFPQLIRLSPVAVDGHTPCGEPVTAAGKHLSDSGLSFFHPHPLSHRLMIASLEKPEGGWLQLLLDVDWCRFTRCGWYESGGRFIRVVPPAPFG